MPVWQARYPGVESMKVAVMGCIVNGPGESKHADIGISLPGTGEAPDRPGVHRRQEGADAARARTSPREFQRMVADYVERRYGRARRRLSPRPARTVPPHEPAAPARGTHDLIGDEQRRHRTCRGHRPRDRRAATAIDEIATPIFEDTACSPARSARPPTW